MLGELWSIMGFANPGLLGSAERFAQRFVRPIERDRDLRAQRTLRRAACDPRLVNPELGIAGAKVQAFAELAAEIVANGHKALVFSQFVDFLGLLREAADAAGLRHQYLDGATPAAEDQASGRAHRIGQARPVTVYRLVTAGSIEERIARLHHEKRALADGILEDAGTAAAAPDAVELIGLLRGE